MTVLPVILHPASILREKSSAVNEITPEIIRLLDDMVDTMYSQDGIGLAAPQVNVAKRLVVMDIEPREEGQRGNLVKLINPEIISASETKTVLDEGCLSLPQMRVELTRPEFVTVRYMDVTGKIQEIEADGLMSKCLQHEIDHLDGVLIFDHVSSLKRNIILRRYNKYLRNNGP